MIPLPDRLLKLENWRAGDIGAFHPVFNAPRAAYPDFVRWYNTAQFERRRMYAVTSNGVPVGIAILKVEGDKLKLCCLSVLVGHEGHGVGSMLMKAYLTDAADFGFKPYFTTRIDAPPSVRRFVRKHGFDAIGHIHGDHHWVLHDGEPMWIAPRD